MGPFFQKALKLLAAGDIAGAVEVHNEISTAIQGLEEDRDLVDEMISRIKADAPEPAGPPAPSNGRVKLSAAQQTPLPGMAIKPRMRKVSQVERSNLIKKYAADIAEAHQGKLGIESVETAFKDAGIDIGTKIPGTVIANVLMKAGGWNRVGRGQFERDAAH